MAGPPENLRLRATLDEKETHIDWRPPEVRPTESTVGKREQQSIISHTPTIRETAPLPNIPPPPLEPPSLADEFLRGISAANEQSKAAKEANAAREAELQGNLELRDRHMYNAGIHLRRAATREPTVSTYKEATTIPKAIRYALGLTGQAAPSVLRSITYGTAGRIGTTFARRAITGATGARATTRMASRIDDAGGFVGATGSMYPDIKGGIILSQENDPVISQLPVEQRERAATLTALGSSGLEGIVPGAIGSRVARRAFARSGLDVADIIGRRSSKGLLKRNMLSEGLTELSQQHLEQFALHLQNPELARFATTEEGINAFLGGVAGGALGHGFGRTLEKGIDLAARYEQPHGTTAFLGYSSLKPKAKLFRQTLYSIPRLRGMQLDIDDINAELQRVGEFSTTGGLADLGGFNVRMTEQERLEAIETAIHNNISKANKPVLGALLQYYLAYEKVSEKQPGQTQAQFERDRKTNETEWEKAQKNLINSLARNQIVQNYPEAKEVEGQIRERLQNAEERMANLTRDISEVPSPHADAGDIVNEALAQFGVVENEEGEVVDITPEGVEVITADTAEIMNPDDYIFFGIPGRVTGRHTPGGAPEYKNVMRPAFGSKDKSRETFELRNLFKSVIDSEYTTTLPDPFQPPNETTNRPLTEYDKDRVSYVSYARVLDMLGQEHGFSQKYSYIQAAKRLIEDLKARKKANIEGERHEAIQAEHDKKIAELEEALDWEINYNADPYELRNTDQILNEHESMQLNKEYREEVNRIHKELDRAKEATTPRNKQLIKEMNEVWDTYTGLLALGSKLNTQSLAIFRKAQEDPTEDNQAAYQLHQEQVARVDALTREAANEWQLIRDTIQTKVTPDLTKYGRRNIRPEEEIESLVNELNAVRDRELDVKIRRNVRKSLKTLFDQHYFMAAVKRQEVAEQPASDIRMTQADLLQAQRGLKIKGKNKKAREADRKHMEQRRIYFLQQVSWAEQQHTGQTVPYRVVEVDPYSVGAVARRNRFMHRQKDKGQPAPFHAYISEGLAAIMNMPETIGVLETDENNQPVTFKKKKSVKEPTGFQLKTYEEDGSPVFTDITPEEARAHSNRNAEIVRQIPNVRLKSKQKPRTVIVSNKLPSREISQYANKWRHFYSGDLASAWEYTRNQLQSLKDAPDPNLLINAQKRIDAALKDVALTSGIPELKDYWKTLQKIVEYSFSTENIVEFNKHLKELNDRYHDLLDSFIDDNPAVRSLEEIETDSTIPYGLSIKEAKRIFKILGWKTEKVLRIDEYREADRVYGEKGDETGTLTRIEPAMQESWVESHVISRLINFLEKTRKEEQAPLTQTQVETALRKKFKSEKLIQLLQPALNQASNVDPNIIAIANPEDVRRYKRTQLFQHIDTIRNWLDRNFPSDLNRDQIKQERDALTAELDALPQTNPQERIKGLNRLTKDTLKARIAFLNWQLRHDPADPLDRDLGNELTDKLRELERELKALPEAKALSETAVKRQQAFNRRVRKLNANNKSFNFFAFLEGLDQLRHEIGIALSFQEQAFTENLSQLDKAIRSLNKKIIALDGRLNPPTEKEAKDFGIAYVPKPKGLERAQLRYERGQLYTVYRALNDVYRGMDERLFALRAEESEYIFDQTDQFTGEEDRSMEIDPSPEELLPSQTKKAKQAVRKKLEKPILPAWQASTKADTKKGVEKALELRRKYIDSKKQREQQTLNKVDRSLASSAFAFITDQAGVKGVNTNKLKNIPADNSVFLLLDAVPEKGSKVYKQLMRVIKNNAVIVLARQSRVNRKEFDSFLEGQAYLEHPLHKGYYFTTNPLNSRRVPQTWREQIETYHKARKNWMEAIQKAEEIEADNEFVRALLWRHKVWLHGPEKQTEFGTRPFSLSPKENKKLKELNLRLRRDQGRLTLVPTKVTKQEKVAKEAVKKKRKQEREGGLGKAAKDRAERAFKAQQKQEQQQREANQRAAAEFQTIQEEIELGLSWVTDWMSPDAREKMADYLNGEGLTEPERRMRRDLNRSIWKNKRVRLQVSNLLGQKDIRRQFKVSKKDLQRIVQDKGYYYAMVFQLATDPDINLRLTPRTEQWFKRLVQAILEIFGIHLSSYFGEAIITEMMLGNLKNKDDIDAVYKKYGTKADKNVHQMANVVRRAAEKSIKASVNVLYDLDIPVATELAKEFDRFIPRRKRQNEAWLTKLQKEVLSQFSIEDFEEGWQQYRIGKPKSDAAKAIQQYVNRVYGYMHRSGARLTIYENGKFKNVRAAKRKWRVPLTFDIDKIAVDREGLETLFVKHGLDLEQAHKVVSGILWAGGHYALVENKYDYDTDPTNVTTLSGLLQVINKKNIKEFEPFLSDDGDIALTKFARQAVHKAEFSKSFEHNGAIIDKVIQKLKARGLEPKQVKYIEDRVIPALLGTLSYKMHPKWRKVIGTLVTIQNFAVLPLMLFPAMVDIWGISMTTGEMSDGWKAFKNGLKEIKNSIVNEEDDDWVELAETIGIISDQSLLDRVGDTYNEMLVESPLLKWANQKFFFLTGIEQWTKGVRIAALQAGVRYLAKHRNDAEKMAAFGLKPGDVKVDEENNITNLTDDNVGDALNLFVDSTVLRPSAAHRPAWGSDPFYLLVWHLKQFTFTFHHVFLRKVIAELNKSNPNYWILLPFLMMVPTMMASDAVRNIIAPSEYYDNMSFTEAIMNAVGRSSILGVGTFGLDAVRDVDFGKIPGTSFLGPTADSIIRFHDKDFAEGIFRLTPGYALWNKWF